MSEEDGRFLRVMVARAARRRALEIGGANGYSAIWIGLGLRETGGRLTTIEYDPARARTRGREHPPGRPRRHRHRRAWRRVQGDSEGRRATFDFVFLDAWKRDYKRFFDLVFPRLQPAGLFLAHNVVNKRERDARFSRRDPE